MFDMSVAHMGRQIRMCGKQGRGGGYGAGDLDHF